MDQQKIGRFIAELRHERGLTQRELAQRLGVTDRAVSKWENGRGLPDLSLIAPLGEALGITLNELLSGERIAPEQLPAQAEETIKQTVRYSETRVRNTRRLLLSILAAVLALVTTACVLFAVDVHRMRQNRPVFFSTWGFSYAPAIDLNEEEILLAIKRHLTARADAQAKDPAAKSFAAMRTFLLEEQVPDSRYRVYAWVVCESYTLQDGVPVQESGYSIPHRFTVEQAGETFAVTEESIPRDGSYYEQDLHALFPREYHDELENVHIDGTVERLKLQIEEQVALYFHE